MEVILHLGVHRSATTTLQRHLQQNAPAYRRAGLEVWVPVRTRAGLFDGLIRNPSRATAPIDHRAARSANRVRLEIDRLERGAMRQLLISEENIIGAVRNNLRAASLYPDLPERISRFLPALGHHPGRVALGLRAYDSYWASALAFAIGRGFPAPDHALLGKLVDQVRSWRTIVAEIADLCPDTDIVVWPFEALADDPARQVDVMTRGIRLDDGTTREAGRHNASPGGMELERILALRGKAPAMLQLSPHAPRWMPFDPAQRAWMRARYLEDLDWLASGAGANVRLHGAGQDTADQRRVRNNGMLDRASDVSGFAAPARAWMPLNGGRGIGNERRMV